VARTGSLVARNLLASWDKGARDRFVKVMPRDYKRALAERAEEAEPEAAVEA
jgi:glutamate synthase (NADPH/NADH) large chain